LLDDFAVGENGFIGPPPGPDALAQIDRHHKLAAAGLASGLQSHGTALTASIRSGKMPDRKFNLTVGALAPFFDYWCETSPGRLIDNFAGFAASRVEGQRKCLWPLLAGHPACQLTGANEHVGTPKLVNADGHEHLIVKRKYGQSSGRFVPAVHRATNKPRSAVLPPCCVEYPASICKALKLLVTHSDGLQHANRERTKPKRNK
jgi:hypothetical protein